MISMLYLSFKSMKALWEVLEGLGGQAGDRERGKDIPEELMQQLDTCKNAVCWAGVSQYAGLGSASNFAETSEGRLERELKSVSSGTR